MGATFSSTSQTAVSRRGGVDPLMMDVEVLPSFLPLFIGELPDGIGVAVEDGAVVGIELLPCDHGDENSESLVHVDVREVVLCNLREHGDGVDFPEYAFGPRLRCFHGIS